MSTKTGLKSAHNQASASHIQQVGLILDHLVDALGGDPSSPLRRAIILTDIDEHPETTQTGVMDRLKIDKHTLNRDIQWLYDQGCILRNAGLEDGRVIHIVTCGYSKKNLALALDYVEKSHKNLKKFLNGYISIFKDHKPTLRDAKIMATMADLGTASKQELLSRSYEGPQTTNARALEGLIEEGLLSRNEDDG